MHFAGDALFISYLRITKEEVAMTGILRSLPIGVQSFENIRNRGYVYVDKTPYIKDLLRGQVYFLSRPRRFGKSLLLSTLAAYFEGKKELFKGLFLEQGEPELAAAQGREAWEKYPVLRFDLNAKNYIDPQKLIERLSFSLRELEEQYGIERRDEAPEERFQYLIRNLYQRTGKQVVLLIDEYDKPLMDSIHLPELYEAYLGILHGFYSVIKESDRYIRFVFLTGVSRFGKLTIFSGLNNLKDISMDPYYSGICGITETELVSNFSPELARLSDALEISQTEALAELKKRYDGYQFAKKGEHVYNPFSLLNVLDIKELDDYWYATGTPTFLVKYLQKTDFFLPELDGDVEMAKEDLQVSPLEVDTPLPILFQAGYLTIKEYIADGNVYRLGFPNEEVRYGFLKNLLQGYSSVVKSSASSIAAFLREIRSGNVDAFMTHLKSIIGGIPYNTIKENETYHERDGEVAVYLVFSLMGQFTQTEVHCPGGRADTVVHTADAVYVFEFKMEDSATPEDALAQIDERGYAARYLSSEKKVLCIGVTFDPETRNIGEWALRQL